MAQVDQANNPNDPNNPNAPQSGNQPQGQTNQPAPATSGGAGAVTATGAANTAGQVVGTANPSQPFQNISAYLAANAPQSEALASQVAGTVTAPIAKANTDIQNASTDFTKSVNSGYTAQDNDIVGRLSNPTELASNPNDVAAFQAQLNDTYKGPTDFTSAPGYSNIESEIASAQTNAQNAFTPSGIQSLLKGVEGPTTAGVNNLDTLLLAQNPKNAQTIADAGNLANTKNNNLGNFLTSQTTANNDAAKTAAANAIAAKTAAGQALTAQEQAFANSINKEVADAKASATAYNTPIQDLQRALETGDFSLLTPADNAVLASGEGGKYFSPTFSSLLNPYQTAAAGLPGFNLPTNPNLSNAATLPNLATIPQVGNVATADDYAKAAAFNTLAGSPQALPLDPNMASQAGKFALPTENPTFNTQTAALDLLNLLYGTGIQNIPGGTQTVGKQPFDNAVKSINDWLTANFGTTNAPPPPDNNGPTLGGPTGVTTGGGGTVIR